MKSIRLLVMTCLFAAAAVFARADVPPEKRQEIEKMLQLTGMERLMEQMKSQIIVSLSANASGVPAEFWQKFAEKMKVREVIDKLIPLYDKYYSLEDLKAVNAFYSSPAGQRVLATLPQIMKEAMEVGQEWGRRVGEEAVAEIKAMEASKSK